MTSVRPTLPLASLIAVWLVVWLSISAVLTSLDLVLHLLPMRYPAFQYLHSASASTHLLWSVAGVAGVLSARFLYVRPVHGLSAVIAFSILYAVAAPLIWRQFTLGCWAAVSSSIFAAVGALQVWRANQSFKRTREKPRAT